MLIPLIRVFFHSNPGSTKAPSNYFEKTVVPMSPLRPSKLAPPDNDKGSFIGGFIQFLNEGSTKSSSLSPVPSMRDDVPISPSAFIMSKDIVIKKLSKVKSNSQPASVERRKSISKARKSPSKSSNKSQAKSLLSRSAEMPSNEQRSNHSFNVPNMCDKQLRLCIEDVRNPIRSESSEVASQTITKTAECVNNGTAVANATLSFSKVSHQSHCAADHKSSIRPFSKSVTNSRKSILAPPVLQPSKFKQNGDTLLLTGTSNLIAAVAAENIKLNNFASRTSTTPATKTPTVAINQFTQPNTNAAIEVNSFLANSSIIKTK